MVVAIPNQLDLAKRIAELEAAQRRAIALIERLLPYVMWDEEYGDEEEANARVTLELLREAVKDG